jgi:hypothetical protein
MANIILDAIKGQGVSTTFSLNKGDLVSLAGFDLSQAQLFVNQLGQLIVVLPDGTQFMLSNFAELLEQDPNMAFLVNAGQEVSFSDVISKFVDGSAEIEPALGPTSFATSSTTDALSDGSGAALGSTIGLTDGDGLNGGFALSSPTITVGTASTNTGDNDSDDFFIADTGIAPTLNNGTTIGDEDTSFDLNITAPTDADSDDSSLTITVSGLPTAQQGEITLNGVPLTPGQVLTPAELGSLVFTPAPDFSGTVSFDYVVSDGLNTSNSSQTIIVENVQDNPEFSGPSSVTINEDDPATDLNMEIPTDADTPYGDVLTISINTPLSSIEGTITLDGVAITDGQTFTADELARLQFTPTENYNGSFTIDYTVTDSAGNTASNQHTVTVDSVEDIPVANDSSSTIEEDTIDAPLNIPVPTDGDGDALTAVINTLPTNGTLKFADGTLVQAGVAFDANDLGGLTFTPNADFTGDVTIDYTVSDGKADVDATHTVTVAPENDSPIVTDSTSSQDEDTADVTLGINVPTDPEGDALTAKIDSLPTNGTLKFANGTLVPAGVEFDAAELAGITFTPNADFNGTVEIDYTISDGVNTPVDGKHTVTVNPVEDAPEIPNPSSSSSVDEDQTAGLGIQEPTDADGDALTVVINTLPTNGTLTFADGTPVQAGVAFTPAQLAGLQITPDADFNGTITIDYTVSDGKTDVDGQHTVTVNPVNDAPAVTDSTSTQDEDSTDVTLGINTPTDVDGDSLTAQFDSLPTEGTLKFADGTLVQAGVAFDAAQLAGITFTPNANFNGTVELDYSVSDGTVTTDGKHTVTVTGENDFPNITDSTSSQDEDTSGGLGIPVPTDPDGDTLIANIPTLPTEGTLTFADGTPVVAGQGFDVSELPGLIFTPNPDFFGTVEIKYEVTDGTVTVDGTHTITVEGVEDLPVIPDPDSSSSVDEDSTADLNIQKPTDADGDDLTVVINTLPTDGTLTFADGTPVQAGVAFTPDQLAGLQITPNPDFNGTITIDYTVSDGKADVDGQHTVTVTPTNDAPVVNDSTSSQNEDTADGNLGIPLPSDADGDSLTVTIGNLPTNGTLTFANGTPVVAGQGFDASQLPGLVFTPDENFNGTVDINYSVSDGTTSTDGKHTITVNPVNDAPTVTDSSSNQPEDSTDVTLGINTPTDIDGDDLTAKITSLPSQGTLKFADGTLVQAGVSFDADKLAGITFTPNDGFNGEVDINYTVSDGTATSNGQHTVTVDDVNQAPDVTNSNSSMDEDTVKGSLNIPVPTDPDGDALTVVINQLPSNGTLTFANGAIVQAGQSFSAADLAGIKFTPNANFNGVVEIDYSVSDGTTSTDGTHTVTVNPVNDAPTVVNSSSTMNEDTYKGSLGIPTPSDVDGDSLTVTIGNLPGNGTLTFANGALVQPGVSFSASELAGIKFTPDANFNGTVNINYSVSDGKTSTNGTHTVTVNPVNDAPTVVANSSTVMDEDTKNVSLNIPRPTDVDGDSLTVRIDSLPANGVLKFANGTVVQAGMEFSVNDLLGLTFTPNPDFNGNVSFDYIVSDGKTTSTGSHNITVNDVPEPVEDIVLRYDNKGLTDGIVADLNNGTVDRGNGQVDDIDNYRGIVATDYDDVIIAQNGHDNYIQTGQGDDLVYAGSGADNIQGGYIGMDTVSYENSNGAVNINLANGTASGGYASGDKLNEIEGLIGSRYNDTLIGDRHDNYLDGGAGSDNLAGGAGNDTIIFDGNDNSISGGSGKDTLKVTDKFSSDNGHIDLSNVMGGNLDVTGIEVIDMENGLSNETLHINVKDILSTAENNELIIKGDLLLDFSGATNDDNVHFADKTMFDILDAHQGVKVIDGVRYDVLDFGNEGTIYVEEGLDIIDAYGSGVMI